MEKGKGEGKRKRKIKGKRKGQRNTVYLQHEVAEAAADGDVVEQALDVVEDDDAQRALVGVVKHLFGSASPSQQAESMGVKPGSQSSAHIIDNVVLERRSCENWKRSRTLARAVHLALSVQPTIVSLVTFNHIQSQPFQHHLFIFEF